MQISYTTCYCQVLDLLYSIAFVFVPVIGDCNQYSGILHVCALLVGIIVGFDNLLVFAFALVFTTQNIVVGCSRAIDRCYNMSMLLPRAKLNEGTQFPSSSSFFFLYFRSHIGKTLARDVVGPHRGVPVSHSVKGHQTWQLRKILYFLWQI